MATASATPLPWGVTPPLTTDDEDNHGGLIVVMTSLSLVLVLSSLAARIYSVVQRHNFQRDDLLFGILVVSRSMVLGPSLGSRCSASCLPPAISKIIIDHAVKSR